MKNETHQNQTQFQTFNDFQLPTRKPKKDLKKINNSFFMSDEIRVQVENTIKIGKYCSKSRSTRSFMG